MFKRLWVLPTLLLSSCTELGVATANLFTYTDNITVDADISYGDNERQILNVYRSEDGSPNLLKPVIIFFYGGGWQTGNRNIYRFAAEPFTSNGFVVVIPDYAKYPKYRYPVFAEDAAKSVKWVTTHIHNYGGDPSRIFLMGHSAGAHIGALLLTDKTFLAHEKVNTNHILGFAGLAGPYDFVPTDPAYKDIFSPVKPTALAMPTTHVDGSEPPMLLLQGDKDAVVDISNLKSMQKQIKVHGGKVEVKIYSGIDHINIISALSKPARKRAPVVKDVVDFFNSQLRN